MDRVILPVLTSATIFIVLVKYSERLHTTQSELEDNRIKVRQLRNRLGVLEDRLNASKK